MTNYSLSIIYVLLVYIINETSARFKTAPTFFKLIIMKNKNNPFDLTDKERVIEFIGILIFAIVFVGSALKLLFF